MRIGLGAALRIYDFGRLRATRFLDLSCQSHSSSKFNVTAESIRKLHLTRSLALRFEESGICDKNACAFCA